MALPDAGNVEDYTEAEMMELVKLNETDKSKLTKNQKAAIARYNFKKNKGEPLPFKGSGVAAAPAPAAPAPAAAAPAADIISLLSPEMQALAARDPATLSKEEKIALAKSKSQAVKAQVAASGAPAAAAKPAGPTPEEIAAKKAQEYEQSKALALAFPQAIVGWQMQTDKPSATIQPGAVFDIVRYLRDEMGFDTLRLLTATDYPPERLEVVYNLYRPRDHAHLALKCKLPRDAPAGKDMPSLPSITPLHAGADWLEREVFDMLGIRFDGHPYMRRLMMPDGWVGYPLRKDYDMKTEQFIGLDEKGDDIVTTDSSMGW